MDNGYKQLVDMALDVKDFAWAKELIKKSNLEEESIKTRNRDDLCAIISSIIKNTDNGLDAISEKIEFWLRISENFIEK